MFAGVFSRHVPVSQWGDATQWHKVLAPFAAQAPRAIWQTQQAAMVQVATATGAPSAPIHQAPASGVVAVFWGRLDNREALQSALAMPATATDDALVAAAWTRWGEACPEHLIGDFAFALACPDGRVFLARDVMGVKPLFYRIDEHGLAFASSVALFRRLQLGSCTPSEQWVAKFTLHMSMSHTETAYHEIRKLPGAHSLLWHPDGRSSLRRYHRFVDDAPYQATRQSQWLDDYRAVWQEAVRCRVPQHGPIGSENSGGIDSGSITAEIARQLGPNQIHRLYGFGFCHMQQEPEHIMATAMKYHIPNNFLVSGHSGRALDDISARELLVSGYPQEHGNGSSHHPFYSECQLRGISVLHSGFGGDEVATNPGGHIRAELVDRHAWRTLWSVLPGALPHRLGRAAQSLWRAFRPETVNSQFLEAWKRRWPFQMLHPDVLARYELETAYFKSAAYGVGFRSVNAFALNRLAEPFVPTRLENCTLMAASFGVEYVWPLWDVRLVQQWLSTPAVWKVGPRGIGRYLHRSAISGVSADAVAWKRSKDMGYMAQRSAIETQDLVPVFGQWREALDDLPPMLTGLLDVPRLQALAEQGRREQWQGQDIAMMLSRNIGSLRRLKQWLQHAP